MFQYQSINKTSGSIFFSDQLIAEIRDLCLCNVRFKSDGKILIGSDVPIPLCWRQYANHEHPDRNAGSNGIIKVVEATEVKIIIECCGTNESSEVSSEYRVELFYSNQYSSFVFDITAQLHVIPCKQWFVTYNAHHGELEFCNVYPTDTFVLDRNSTKRYNGCYVSRTNEVIKIPHHHLESSDKHNIEMHCGDSFCWLLEDENIGVQILSDQIVHAGLCAYMWDAHFAYRVCDKSDKYLHENFSKNIRFKIFSLDRKSGEAIVRNAKELCVPELETTPVYGDGLITFSDTILSYPERHNDIWPWSNEIIDGTKSSVDFTYDRDIKYDGKPSLKIYCKESLTARWLATSLGPAFGGKKFEGNRRYKLSAYIKTYKVAGDSCLGIRLHREGIGSVFEIEKYDSYFSDKKLSGKNEWTYIEIITPVISPLPDRVHLILQQSGMGISWFNNILFEMIF